MFKYVKPHLDFFWASSNSVLPPKQESMELISSPTCGLHVEAPP